MQGEETKVDNGQRFLQVRCWTAEVDAWTHLIIAPNKAGPDAVVAAATGRQEPESCNMARAAFKGFAPFDL